MVVAEVEVEGVVWWEAHAHLDNFFCPLNQSVCSYKVIMLFFLTGVTSAHYRHTLLVVDCCQSHDLSCNKVDVIVT